MEITAALVKDLRERTGAGMMECKKALQEAKGDIGEAEVVLRKHGISSAGKKAGRVTKQGLIGTYIHAGGQLGVMVEVNCESDFVARTGVFQELVHDVAMHIAAADPRYLRREDVPAAVLEKEKEIARARALLEGKPEKILDRIVEGRLSKFYEEVFGFKAAAQSPPSPSISSSKPRLPSWARTSASAVSSASKWATWRRPKPAAKAPWLNRSPSKCPPTSASC